MTKDLEPYQLVERSIQTKFRKGLWNPFIAAVKRYALISPGDRIAVNIPAEQLAADPEQLPKDRPVILICYIGMASEQAAGKLAALGYRVTHVDGGYKAYSKLIPAPDEESDMSLFI